MSDPTETETVVLTLLEARGQGKSICPSEAARVLAGEGRWQSRLTDVRAAAVRLAGQGRLEITRKGKPVDPQAFKGVYRLRLPRGDDGA